jgi:peptidoglycan L-alanyl-D-glutamate endopeptidase CwlK
MPYFSESSLEKLSTVHSDLITLFTQVVKDFDCTVISGLRTLEEQQALYAKGRSEPGEIVTNCDGVNRRSNHQSGNAVDVVPYPIDWSDTKRMREFGWYVLGVANTLKRQGVMSHNVMWGGQWTRFPDLPHFELKT